MPNSAIPPYEDEPDHMIIWLDQHIGDPTRCQQLKKAFSTNVDPQNPLPVALFDEDRLETLFLEEPVPVHFEGVHFLLAAFTDIPSCIRCFERNQNKRIFFITSGTRGERAIPAILESFKETFTDPDTDEAYPFIYIFCFDKIHTAEWAIDYIDYVHIFDHEGALLARMMRDIADYFTTQGERLLDESPPNNAAAYHRLCWAHELFQRFEKLEKASVRAELDKVNQLLQAAEDELKPSSDEED